MHIIYYIYISQNKQKFPMPFVQFVYSIVFLRGTSVRHRRTALFRILTPFLGRLGLAYVLSFPRSKSHFTKIIQPKKVIKTGQNRGNCEPQNSGTVAAVGVQRLGYI